MLLFAMRLPRLRSRLPFLRLRSWEWTQERDSRIWAESFFLRGGNERRLGRLGTKRV